jgi:hypothetical protein
VNALAIREALTDTELPASTRVMWAFLLAAPEPQNSSSLGENLGMGSATISRGVKLLKDRHLIRRSNGVWIPEVSR